MSSWLKNRNDTFFAAESNETDDRILIRRNVIFYADRKPSGFSDLDIANLLDIARNISSDIIKHSQSTTMMASLIQSFIEI